MAQNGKLHPIQQAFVDEHGRVATWTEGTSGGPGVYRLTFDTATYHQDIRSFFPEVQVIFEVNEGDDHVHVPLLLSPFGYSTYRGV